MLEYTKKKSHTCEEGGVQLIISFKYLLMNLKNNYLFKKLLKWNNKNVRILLLMLYFFKIYIYKNTRNHHQCHSILTILFYFFFLEQDGLKIKT